MQQVTAVVDFGTSHTVVVVSGPGVPAQLVRVDGASWFPSAVFWRRDGRAILGAEAEALARAEPARLERHPKARIGEPEVLLGDSVVPTAVLIRAVLAAVIAEAIRVARAPVQHLVLTHPADWGATRLGALLTAAQGLVPRLSAVAEPVGAAAWFATRHDLPVGAVLAVLDFGGGTCDAAIVRRESTGLSVIDCAGLPDLGGADLDQRIVERLRGSRPALAVLLDEADRTRPAAAAELREITRLRAAVRLAKEELSNHQQVDVTLPAGLPEVLLTRSELETTIEPDIRRAVELLTGTVRACGLSGTELAAVHLVGGSSRIPALAQRLRAELPVPVLLDDQPEVVVALGAHAALEPRTLGADPVAPESVTEIAAEPTETRSSRRAPAMIAAAVLVVAVAVIATLVSVGTFRPTVAGSPIGRPGAVVRLTLPTPKPGTKIAVPGDPTAALTSAKPGEYVDIKNHMGFQSQWRLDSFTDTGSTHRQLVALGNENRPGHRWILVRVTEKVLADVPNYQPAHTYLVDDRGLMLGTPSVPPKLPADCPAPPGSQLAAGTEVAMCLVFLVPEATPIVQVVTAALSHDHPTNLKVRESITNGARVEVDGRRVSADAPDLPATALDRGVSTVVRSTTFGADVAVVDTIEDISGYFDVQYSNDTVIGLPGAKGVLVRIAAQLRDPLEAGKLPIPTVSVEDDRGAVVTSPFRAQRNECVPLTSTARLTGTIVFCALVAVPDGTPLRAVRLSIAPGAEVKTWRL